MNLALPVYVEEHKVPGQPAPQFLLRPLFFTAPHESGPVLSTVLAKLAREIRKRLDALADAPRHDELIPWTFAPDLAQTPVKFTLQLRRQTAECRLLVVSFEAFDRRIGFIPALGDLFFEINRGQNVTTRAREVITEHFRQIEKDEGDDFVLPRRLATPTRAFVTTLQLDIHPRPRLKSADRDGFMALLSHEKLDGRQELQKVGRCLDWFYPDQLERAVLREREVEELLALLGPGDRRPVLLLGPRRCGKTTIIHETVFRRVEERKQPHVIDRNLWLLSPARLISGMSYVGQWEGRLLAILAEARDRQHVLYFDDVLGLFLAGRSADSDLSVAAVMRAWVERRDFRMLAEMTPDAFRILKEKDRAFADLFHILPIRETDHSQTRRVLIHSVRRLETVHKCRFTADVIPTVLDLTTRYVRDQAMPGKAAGLVAQLALKFREQDITRFTTMAEFAARSGLAVSFLDHASRLERQSVVSALSRELIGQPSAVEALADVVTIAKARLNDPARPLGAFLFLGPTGVGKTQAAKVIANYLFGHQNTKMEAGGWKMEKGAAPSSTLHSPSSSSSPPLLRFDMNEFLDASAAARLVGTFHQPEGLLTSAVRRQPWCVLLLDEIEKAHPAVFDILLQVLGEGRLTDALGRTADFTNALIIMTSNLGAREAGATFGLKPRNASADDTYLHAAERFFRPEFFNRIDRVVPFSPLSRENIADIANQLIAALFQREGLVHRRCVLDVDAAAMNRLIDQGYHPDLGARALKRAIERQLTHPIATRLAAMAPDAPTLVSIFPAKEGITAHVQAMTHAPRRATELSSLNLADPEPLLESVDAFLNRIETSNQGGASTTLSADKLGAADFCYLALREQVGRIDRMVQSFDQALKRPANRLARSAPRKPRRLKRLPADQPLDPSLLHGQLAHLAAKANSLLDHPQENLLEILLECGLLNAMTPAPDDPSVCDRVLVLLRPLTSRTHPLLDQLRDLYLKLMGMQYGFVTAALPSPDPCCQVLLMELPGISRIMRHEAGTHLLYPGDQNVLPVQVVVRGLSTEEDATTVAARLIEQRNQWRAAVAAGQAPTDADPAPLAPILRIYDPASSTLDVRTGLVCPHFPSPDELRRMILELLPPVIGGAN